MQGKIRCRSAKKSWRQAVDNLRLRHPETSIGCLSRLFGKTREGYYSVSREKRGRLELRDNEIVAMVKEIRSQAPGLGAYKLFVMLKDIFGVSMPGRDRFYALMHDNGLMLKPGTQASYYELQSQLPQVYQPRQGLQTRTHKQPVGCRYHLYRYG